MSDSPSLNSSINKGRVRRPSGNKVSYIYNEDYYKLILSNDIRLGVI